MTLDDLPDILTVREAADYLRIGLNSACREWVDVEAMCVGPEPDAIGVDDAQNATGTFSSRA